MPKGYSRREALGLGAKAVVLLTAEELVRRAGIKQGVDAVEKKVFQHGMVSWDELPLAETDEVKMEMLRFSGAVGVSGNRVAVSTGERRVRHHEAGVYVVATKGGEMIFNGTAVFPGNAYGIGSDFAMSPDGRWLTAWSRFQPLSRLGIPDGIWGDGAMSMGNLVEMKRSAVTTRILVAREEMGVTNRPWLLAVQDRARVVFAGDEKMSIPVLIEPTNDNSNPFFEDSCFGVRVSIAPGRDTSEWGAYDRRFSRNLSEVRAIEEAALKFFADREKREDEWLRSLGRESEIGNFATVGKPFFVFGLWSGQQREPVVAVSKDAMTVAMSARCCVRLTNLKGDSYGDVPFSRSVLYDQSGVLVVQPFSNQAMWVMAEDGLTGSDSLRRDRTGARWAELVGVLGDEGFVVAFVGGYEGKSEDSSLRDGYFTKSLAVVRMGDDGEKKITHLPVPPNSMHGVRQTEKGLLIEVAGEEGLQGYIFSRDDLWRLEAGVIFQDRALEYWKLVNY